MNHRTNKACKYDQAWENFDIYKYLSLRKAGNNQKFETIEIMWEAFISYAKWAKETPHMIPKKMKMKGDAGDYIQSYEDEVSRYISINEFCNFCSMGKATFFAYRDGKFGDDFKELAEIIVDNINNYKIQGGAIGIYAHGIVSKEVGLVERTEVKSLTDDFEKLISDASDD